MSILTSEDYKLMDYAIYILKDYTAYPGLLINTIYTRLAKNEYRIVGQILVELRKIYQHNFMILKNSDIPSILAKLAALLVALDFRANGTELGYVDDQAIQDQANHQDKRVWCNFCKKNGERYIVYSSHSLKNKFGFVMCPVLQRYTCPICNATGYHAHTLKYCPKLK